MNIRRIFSGALIIWFFSVCFMSATERTSEITFEIKWIGIRHGTPDNLNLGTIQYSAQVQEITWKFAKYFWVEDLMWFKTGHYTTIQCNWLYGPTWAIITWIYLMAWSPVPERIFGVTWNVLISSTLNSFQSIYSPLVYIYKPTNNSNFWLANRYGDEPIIKIVVPPNQIAGTYRWIIMFTLYMD
jgi:hypothetical protein